MPQTTARPEAEHQAAQDAAQAEVAKLKTALEAAQTLIGDVVRDFSVYRQRTTDDRPAEWPTWSKKRREAYIDAQARLAYMAGCAEAEKVLEAFCATYLPQTA